MWSTSLETRPGIALGHAVGLRRAGPGAAVLRTQASAGIGEGRCEAAAVVGQRMGEPEGERGSGLAQEGDGAVLGLVVLDREVGPITS